MAQIFTVIMKYFFIVYLRHPINQTIILLNNLFIKSLGVPQPLVKEMFLAVYFNHHNAYDNLKLIVKNMIV